MAVLDWRNRCTPVKDQGNCGSCVAFGTIGAIEANINILTNIIKDLSEAEPFFCSGANCEEGSDVPSVLDREKLMIPLEKEDPYVDHDVSCYTGIATGANITSYTLLTNATQMKAALANGPIVGTMEVHQSFLSYVSGVYHSLGRNDPVLGGHCIVVVGYDDSKGAWICRNSWSTGWGIQGYFYIKYGDSSIETESYSVKVNVTPVPPTPVPPTPTPVPNHCVCGLLQKLKDLISQYS